MFDGFDQNQSSGFHVKARKIANFSDLLAFSYAQAGFCGRIYYGVAMPKKPIYSKRMYYNAKNFHWAFVARDRRILRI